MADEVTEQMSTPTIPDNILDELKKVSEMEKDVSKLQDRTALMYGDIADIKKTIKQSGDEENVISDEDDKKEDKNVIPKDKLKPQLNSVEKKRYENIGVEFVKGAKKVFDEIKKAEVLKNKMSTKRIEETEVKKIKENKEKQEKKGKSLWGLFLKLGLAIAAIVIVLDTFKEKINEIIPGFSLKMNNFTSPIKNIGEKITDKLTSFLQDTIGNDIDNSFTFVRSLLSSFFTVGLPDVIFQSGLTLIEAFGGKVTSDMKYYSGAVQANIDPRLQEGKRQEELLKQKAKENMAVLNNPFASEQSYRRATEQMGLDTLSSIDGFVTKLGRIIDAGKTEDLTDEQAISKVTTNMAGAFMGVIQDGMLDDGQISDDELKRIHQILGVEEDFDKWRNRDEVKQLILPDTLRQLTNAFQTRTNALMSKAQLDERNKQLQTSIREQVSQKIERGKLKLEIEPKKIAQDSFVSELTVWYSKFVDIFSGSDLSKMILDKATVVVTYVYNYFLQPIVNILKELVTRYSSANTPNVPVGVSSSASSISYVTVENTGDSTAPVVVVDFSLDATLANSALNIADTKKKLLEAMKETNDNLTRLKNIVVNGKSEKTGDNLVTFQQLNQVSNDVSVALDFISESNKRITNIENYLEANDNDNIGETTANFEAQTKTPQNK